MVDEKEDDEVYSLFTFTWDRWRVRGPRSHDHATTSNGWLTFAHTSQAPAEAARTADVKSPYAR